MRDLGYAHIDFENKEGKSIEISLPPGYNRLVIGITPCQNFVEEVIEGTSDADKSKKPRLRKEARDALDGQSRWSNEYNKPDFTQSDKEDSNEMSPCQEIIGLRSILNGNIKGHLELIFKEHLGITDDMLNRLKDYGNVDLIDELFGKYIKEKKYASDLIDFLNQGSPKMLEKMQSNNSQNTGDVLVIMALPKELKALRNVRGFGKAE